VSNRENPWVRAGFLKIYFFVESDAREMVVRRAKRFFERKLEMAEKIVCFAVASGVKYSLSAAGRRDALNSRGRSALAREVAEFSVGSRPGGPGNPRVREDRALF